MKLDGNQASIREAIDAGLLAGAVTLVWHAGEIRQVNELGHRDVDARLLMQRDTIFRIASMTKPVTVAAAMSLVDEGRLALTDPVDRWLPELGDMRVLLDPRGELDKTTPARRPITVDDLMTHRSGLAYPFSVLGPLSRAYGRMSFRQDQDRWLAELAQLPLVHQPGERLTYSHATDVLGIALSRIEGKPLADVLRERIFEPLRMTDTGFSVGTEGRRRAATMYKLDHNNALQHDVMGPAPITDPPFCTGGAGLWSTVDDYLRFARMLLAGGALDGVRVLSEESVRVMRTDRLTDEQKHQNFLGAPFWVGRGFGLNLSVVTDPAKSRQLFGPGGLGP
ncbi:serine hydrolase domain-containing protein, partial [Mycobacterium sp. GA-0227b]|uniref:serine hydrolase domain-containing protein n=1 Tax=Mycobacterium sp. GA-0227b TaxID=1772274 RepID=UPI0007417E7B